MYIYSMYEDNAGGVWLFAHPAEAGTGEEVAMKVANTGLEANRGDIAATCKAVASGDFPPEMWGEATVNLSGEEAEALYREMSEDIPRGGYRWIDVQKFSLVSLA